ncbi:MAG: Eco57I restriction-modification methylase domain-containing protein [Anaerolineales bacterium]|nr:Eco57I restriction-modification methylase domain-containing protein [Anaerolineales bacterium]
MPAPDIIKQLVERFEQHYTAYRAGKYNETQLRREFLDPFFEALGWDVFNKLGYSEDHKHVIHEDSLEIEGVKKAPDYAFKVGRERKFFVEAKKPSVKIETNPEVAFQLRRYVWSAKLPLGILTDFEEFAVYECRSKPQVSDSVKTGRVMLFKYTDYIEKWDDIAAIFSHEAVMKGQFDQFANSTAKKKGTAEVDSAFLDEIEGWREALAKNVALRNRDKVRSEADLNYAVQMTIDRIIFLRICEDRGFESENQLQELAKRENIYEGLKSLFEKADRRYNSGLFHFKDETGRGRADTFTTSLEIDDKVLKDVIRDLYYPSPYVFSQIPADILGQIYEQFLGRVIRLTAGGSAKVEEKPEVRKAGGVFYTPTFIVDYIVGNTLGKLLEGKTPEQAAKLRIVDPACGSGTFLLGAYQYLLDWHLDWYLNHDPEKWAKGKNPALVSLPQLRSSIGAGQGGGWKLSVAKKKEILLNNLYGVDIDPQAVEVTKLSLLLKVIEDPGQLTFLDERILPDLGKNIQCGNSLIGPDYFEGQLMVSDEDRVRVNAFDWKAAFPEVFDPLRPAYGGGTSPKSAGEKTLRQSSSADLGEAGRGFDAVVGNPPYIRIQAMREWASEQVEYYAKKYKAASKGNYDIYVVFVEKALSLLNTKGRLGFILPHKFFNAKYGEPLRGIIAKGKHLSKVVHFSDQQVFKGATTYTCLMFLNKQASAEFEFTKVSNLEDWRNQQTSEVSDIVPVGGTSEVSGMINASRVIASEWNFSVGKDAGLFEKLSQMPVKLGDVSHLFVGLQTDADDVYIVEEIRQENNKVLCSSKYTGKEYWLENDHLKPFLKGSVNIRRYYFSDVNKRLIFPYVTSDGKSLLIDSKEYQQKYPLTWAYLEECKPRLSARNKGDMGKDWYGYVYKKNHTRFDSPKLLVPSLATGSCFAADLEGQYYFVGSGGGGGGGYGISLLPDKEINYLYLLGVLNSKVISEFLKSISTTFQQGYYALNRQYIEQLPIRQINFSDLADKARHDKMVSLVERMLGLHKSLASAHNPHEADRLTREVESTDREIDRLVYELYGLTEEEIKIVES